MNEPDDAPPERPTIPPLPTTRLPFEPNRYGGLADLPDLPELPPAVRSTLPQVPHRVMVDLPRPSAFISMEPPRAIPAPRIVTDVPEPTAVAPAEPAPQPKWIGEALGNLFAPSRKKGAIAAVAGTLVLGALGVQVLLTTRSESAARTAPTDTPVARLTTPTVPPEPIDPTKEKGEPTQSKEPIVVPPLPLQALPSGSDSPPRPISEVPAIPPPDLSAFGTGPNFVVAPPVSVTPTERSPTPPGGIRLANLEVPAPAAPTAPVVSVPAPPAPGTAMPIPVLPPQTGPITIPGLPPVSLPMTPAPVNPNPVNPAMPIPVAGPAAPLIVLPPAEPMGSPAPTSLPAAPVMPLAVKPAPEPVPVKPAETPATPAPAAFPPIALLTKVIPDVPKDTLGGFNKPAGADTAVPALPTAATPGLMGFPPVGPIPTQPRTSGTEVRTTFDVDLHRVEAGESYESISRKQYGDAKYADALRRFNRNREIAKGSEIELPPTGELRKRMTPLAPIPATPVPTKPATTDGWTPATKPAPTPTYYTVPRDGMSFWDVAEEALGNRKDYDKVRDLNAKYDANIRFKKGDQVKLPAK